MRLWVQPLCVYAFMPFISLYTISEEYASRQLNTWPQIQNLWLTYDQKLLWSHGFLFTAACQTTNALAGHQKEIERARGKLSSTNWQGLGPKYRASSQTHVHRYTVSGLKDGQVWKTEALVCKQTCLLSLLCAHTSSDTQTKLNQRVGSMLMHANSLIAPIVSGHHI